jgi:hypothetical protein
MATTAGVVISGAVEGPTDEAVLRSLLVHVGAKPGQIYGGQGKQFLKQKIHGYNNAAKHSPWIVLVDLDRDAECAPSLLRAWISEPAPAMCLRVAVREVEAWLLADPDHLSNFLGIPASRVTSDPDELLDPKQTLVELARSSRRRNIREDMVPRPGSGRKVGPAYTSRLIEFVTPTGALWRPDVAAHRSDSLRRCLRCLRLLVETAS